MKREGYLCGMHPALKERLLAETNASEIIRIEEVQTLWSGFGAIDRVYLKDANQASVIIKRIQIPEKIEQPKGWNSVVSKTRKLKSYQVEQFWYENVAPQLNTSIKVPRLLFQLTTDDTKSMVLEDLNSSGFMLSFNEDVQTHFLSCLKWLAEFHVANLETKTDGIWRVGTYWNLASRQEEWQGMKEGNLKKYAQEIDYILSTCNFQTIVHGDAKPANFLFTKDGNAAAVDFQYVGYGAGIKDLVYVMSSALSEDELFEREEEVLNRYFEFVDQALVRNGYSEIIAQKLQKEWRSLYVFAWADFVRFLEGWAPDSSRLNAYSTVISKSLIQDRFTPLEK